MFALQMPMDKYLSLHLLLFRMIEDLLDYVSLKVPDPFEDEDIDDDFIMMDRMDWSIVEENVGPFKWEEPAAGAAGPSAPVSLASIPISPFCLEVTPPIEHSRPVDKEAQQNEAVVNASPQKDGAPSPVNAQQTEAEVKASPQKDEVYSSPQKNTAPPSPSTKSDVAETEQSSQINPTAATEQNISSIIENLYLDLSLGFQK